MSNHEMKLINTKYGVLRCCRWCKVTPEELTSMNGAEKAESESYCEKLQSATV